MVRLWTRRQFVVGASCAAGVRAAGLGSPLITKAATSDAWGDLRGRLVYDGQAPERKKLKVDKDLECCGKFDIRDESLMVGSDGALQNVFVYVRSRVATICPALEEAAEKRVTLDNRGCIFVPHCMSIWYPNQEFHIVNSDPVNQNVAFAPMNDTAANFVLEVGAAVTWKFKHDQRVPVPIACNYHPWERAHILPLAHPYVAITKPDGTFHIPKLPVGEVELQMWQERVGYLHTDEWPRGRRKVIIRPGTNDVGTIKLPPSLLVE